MVEINIPGLGDIGLEYLVLDFNGTIAEDGKLKDTIRERLQKISQNMKIYIITSDTYGTVRNQCEDIPVQLVVLTKSEGMEEKGEFIEKLGYNKVMAIGNGTNDVLMIRKSKIGVCVIGDEGCSGRTLMASDIVVKSIEEGLDLLIKPERIKATLRY